MPETILYIFIGYFSGCLATCIWLRFIQWLDNFRINRSVKKSKNSRILYENKRLLKELGLESIKD